VIATDPDDVVLGATNTSGSTTVIQNNTTSVAALKGIGVSGDGIVGESAGNNRSGVYGFTTVTTGYGVFGRNKALGYGVGGVGQTGVWANGTNYGVYAEAVNGNGVWGVSQLDAGVRGTTYSPTHDGVVGDSLVGGNFVARGSLGGGSGVGVDAWSKSGTGVRAESASGRALDVIGRVRFSRSGRIAVPAGKTFVDVDLRHNGGLGGVPLVFASLQEYRGDVYLAAVRPNFPSAGRLRIFLNKAPGAAAPVAWHVLG
jgi:hypothetical protein